MEDAQVPKRKPDERRTWVEGGKRHTVEIWREPDGSSHELRIVEPIPVDEAIAWAGTARGMRPQERRCGHTPRP